MAPKNNNSIWIWFCGCIAGGVFISAIQSCGKAAASAQGLNIQYEVLNLSPDLGPVSLFINFVPENASNPYVFGVNQGYFYVPYIPSVAYPYQFRPYLVNGQSTDTLFSVSTPLQVNLKYSVFITGTYANNPNNLTKIFTVDTSALPSPGRGKVRFINASPPPTGGLDVYANGTIAFTDVVYPKVSKYIEFPVGTYNFQINGTGSTTALNSQPNVTIQDGRLYTIYAYGYTNRIDSAEFNSGIITNQ